MPRIKDSNAAHDSLRTFPGQQQFPAVNPSIRQKLETEAWRHHPALARRMASRKEHPRTVQRKLRWQDRVLLKTGAWN